jgi:medium-chain acyl-[acyl-carrier-protein] hydrolase
MLEETYLIPSWAADHRGELGLVPTLQILQDVAIKHARILQLGGEAFRAQGFFWVLTRQKLALVRSPHVGESWHVRTWLRVTTENNVVREFSLTCDGAEVGLCTTGWLALSVENRRPARLDAEKILKDVALADQTGLSLPKLAGTGTYQPAATLAVRNSDIDGNHHVNNVRYAQWALDAVPLERAREGRVQGYEANFLAEVRPLDQVLVEAGFQSEWQDFRGLRASDGKVAFLSRLHWVD